jgi:hypothetical protein
MNDTKAGDTGTCPEPCCGATVTPTDPVMEAIAKKLFGIETVPKMEQQRMIRRAAFAGAKELRDHASSLFCA